MAKRYYFTFGSVGHDYYGGWSEVIAESRHDATVLFCKYHQKNGGGLLRCAMVYDEEEFRKTGMYQLGRNFEHGCHEIITANGRTIL